MIDVEKVAQAMAASKGLDWDGKAKGTEYANHGYWTPVARAAIRDTIEQLAARLQAMYPDDTEFDGERGVADWLLDQAKGLDNG